MEVRRYPCEKRLKRRWKETWILSRVRDMIHGIRFDIFMAAIVQHNFTKTSSAFSWSFWRPFFLASFNIQNSLNISFRSASQKTIWRFASVPIWFAFNWIVDQIVVSISTRSYNFRVANCKTQARTRWFFVERRGMSIYKIKFYRGNQV